MKNEEKPMFKEGSTCSNKSGEADGPGTDVPNGETGFRLTDEIADRMEAADLWTPATMTLFLSENPEDR